MILLTLGAVFTTYIGERISDLKLGNGTSLLIFTSIISYLPISFGRTVAQAFQDGNYTGLVTIVISFFLLVLGIVYVQVLYPFFLFPGFCLVYFPPQCFHTKNHTVKGFRKQRGKSHSIMLHDSIVGVEAYRNPPTFLSR